MDPIRRADSRLRRLQRELVVYSQQQGEPDIWEPFSTRSLTEGRSGVSLRRLIDDHVVAFLPPVLPLVTPALTCTEALVQLSNGGQWQVNVRVEAPNLSPAVFVAGFVLNEKRLFAAFAGAVNGQGPSAQVSSPGRIASFSLAGYSEWTRLNYQSAARQGVTFRFVSTADLNMRFRDLEDQLLVGFGDPVFRPLSLLDDEHPSDYHGPPADGPQPVVDSADDGSDGGEPGLSFSVSLMFE